ncbi:MAG TPA: TPM domain-containing protein [Rhizomicrobium sp.]|jgi:putative membrane protein
MRLSAEEKSRIHAAVAAAEARTHVHLAVSVVPCSDRYALFPLVWGALAALFAGAVMALGWRHLHLREGFAIEAGVFIVFSLIFDWWPLRLLLVPAHIRRRHAQALAHREFAARILSNTAHKGGLLFFVSLGERYAEIIADRATHARVGDEAWNKIVADYIRAAKQGHITDGIISAVDACAAVIGPGG